MTISFNNCDISENQTGVRTVSSAKVAFEKTQIKNNGIGVDIIISKEDIIALGLPADTDQEYIKEALNLLKENSDASKEEKQNLLSTTKLFKWLGDISSITTIGSTLIALAR